MLLLVAACGDDSPEGDAPDSRTIPTATLPATLPEPRIITGELTPEAPTPAVDVAPSTSGASPTPQPAATGTAASGQTPDAGARTYTVKSGDIPQNIAAQFNVSVEALLAANPGLNTRTMQVGQVLNIPPSDD